MTATFPHDPALPALRGLTPPDLHRITGSDRVEVLRLRHHPGLRAALHVALGAGAGRREGVIWLLGPEKLSRLKAKRPHLQVDQTSTAAFELFPQDHRLPELAPFLQESQSLAEGLMGAPAAAAPNLVRYRPGLSATFRWLSTAGTSHFVKVARNADTARQAALQDRIRSQIEGSVLALPAVTGLLPAQGVIAYSAAQGVSLEDVLAASHDRDVSLSCDLLLEALQVLWTCDLPELPANDLHDYLRPARRSAHLIAQTDPVAGETAYALVSAAEKAPPVLQQVPIHADLKPDHVFLQPTCATLIDTESLKRGDPDFDLALLDARLDLGPLTGAFSVAARDGARKALARGFGPNFAFFRNIARIHTAKFLVLHRGSDAIRDVRAILAP